MKTTLLSIGTVLNKDQQLKITGGISGDCEPGEKRIIICIPGEDCP